MRIDVLLLSSRMSGLTRVLATVNFAEGLCVVGRI
jgi:hypothetical protein